MINYIKFVYLDSSALVKSCVWPDLFEPGSHSLQRLISDEGVLLCTHPRCIDEASRVFGRRLGPVGCRLATRRLRTTLDYRRIRIDPFVPTLEERKSIDQMLGSDYRKLSEVDRLQLVSLCKGPFTRFEGPSRTILATSDRRLYRAAAALGIKTRDVSR